MVLLLSNYGVKLMQLILFLYLIPILSLILSNFNQLGKYPWFTWKKIGYGSLSNTFGLMWA